MKNSRFPRTALFVLCLMLVMGIQTFHPALAKSTQKTSSEPPVVAHTMLEPSDIEWSPSPDFPKGTQVAILEGDPTRSGPFTLRLKLSRRYKTPAYWSPSIERVTVMSGKVGIGLGSEFNKSEGEVTNDGGFSVIPARTPHYFWAKRKKSVIQIHGMGPWAVHYVSPEDDPRNTTQP
jgi:hypothetical protein